jgi:hypothetical protein
MALNFDMPGRSTRRLADVTGEIARRTGRLTPGGPVPYLHVAVRRTGWKFDWALLDHAVSPHRVITHGRAWTRWGAWRQVHRAHVADATERALGRAGARDRDAAAELRTDGPVT